MTQLNPSHHNNWPKVPPVGKITGWPVGPTWLSTLKIMAFWLLFAGSTSLLIAIFPGCKNGLPNPSEPMFIKPSDLVRSYKDNHDAAILAYSGFLIKAPLNDYVIDGQCIYWFLTTKKTGNYAIVFHFNSDITQKSGVLWVEGKCRDFVTDGIEREIPGYNFHVVITDCRLSSPPTLRQNTEP